MDQEIRAVNYRVKGEKTMKIEDVKNICVVGAGNMGHQIALQCAIRE
jgi:hypothetical protein